MMALETAQLSKRYGSRRGIEGVSLQVPQGALFGFIGPNGAGKSTTIRTTLGLLKADSGSASLLGRSVMKLGPEARMGVGYVPGETNFYDDMTVLQLLEWLGRFHGGAHATRRNALVDVFGVDLAARAVDLSLGNRKKVSILAALQHRPRLVILDEPTNGLDPVMQTRLFDVLLEEARQGVTVFFSSHVLSEVERVCGTVAVVGEGRLVAVEDVEKLRSRQLRRVRVVLAPHSQDSATAAMAGVLGLQGVEHVETHGPVTVAFLYGGGLAPLLAALAALKPVDLRLEEPSLEEIFMRHFVKPVPGSAA